MKQVNELENCGVSPKGHAILIGPVGCGLLFVSSWLFAAVGFIAMMVHDDPALAAKLDFIHWPGPVGSCGLVVCAAVFTFLHWWFSDAAEGQKKRSSSCCWRMPG